MEEHIKVLHYKGNLYLAMYWDCDYRKIFKVTNKRSLTMEEVEGTQFTELSIILEKEN